MISLVWDIKQKATNEPTKQTNCQETKLIGMDNRMVVTKREGRGGKRTKRVEGVKHMVMEGN